MKKFLLSILISSGFLSNTNTVLAQTGKCNWATKGVSTSFWDSCNGKLNPYSVNGAVKLTTPNKCYVYLWTVNGTTAGTGATLSYPVKTNGYYNVCVKVMDTCARCDTTYCSRRYISCISTPCSWRNNGFTFNTWDSCGATKNPYSVNGYITFSTSTTCFIYQWTVNGDSCGKGNVMNYPVTKNGTYNICVKVSDTCNKCDTTLCYTRQFTCIPTPCQWQSYSPNYYFRDSCNSTSATVNAYINFKSSSCFKYLWTVNGTSAGTNNFLTYSITKNGTYNVCVKVTDTCNSCDTTYCSTRVISCMPTPCQWQSYTPYSYFWDSCKTNSASLNAYISFKSSQNCFKYQWTVNGTAAGNGFVMNYPITKNGTYNVCVKISDTCNSCDTTICSSRVITCIPTPCKWTSNKPNWSFWDSCKSFSGSVNGYISFQVGKSCLTYMWTVNSSAAGTGFILNYPITKNGTYNVCVKVSDTCNSCDTTYCFTRVISCIGKCTLTNRGMYFSAWDSCNTSNSTYALNGYIGPFDSCYKYNWYVNSTLVSASRFLYYPITQNGTYNLCLQVIDTCNKCDTTYCSTRVITCIPKTCNWASNQPNYFFWDTCNRTSNSSVNAYVNFLKNKSCMKYQWTVNGNKAGNNYVMNYPITQNGTYIICVKVSDTCNMCDTTYCGQRVITCFASKCNWYLNSPVLNTMDSCNKDTGVIVSYLSINGSKSCHQYYWTVNDTFVGYYSYLIYHATRNGKYKVCLKLIDICNNCDTTFCSTRTISCLAGIKEQLEDANALKVYPNPSKGMLTLDWGLGSGIYTMTSLTGQILKSGAIINGHQELDLSAYASGIYLLRVVNENAVLTKKIHLQKD